MAWNPSPEVAVARDVARRFDNAPMALVFWITPDGTQFGVASYGEDKATCRHAGKLADHLHAAAMKWFEQHGTRGEG